MNKQPFAICRTEKIKNWSTLAKSVGHNLRTSKDDRQHLNPKVAEPIKILAGDPLWVDAWREEVAGMHLRKLAQGCQHTLAREFFLGVSPEWAQGKTQKQIQKWAEANVDWLKGRFGADRVKMAVLHLDEQTPHIAAYVVGRKADPKNRGNGFTLSDESLKLGGGKSALVKLQDEYAEAMKPFDLRRGLHGTKASHEKTARWRAYMSQPGPKVTRPKVPDPTLGNRIDPKTYAEQAAKAAAIAVLAQMKPYQRVAEEQSEKIAHLQVLVERLQPLAEMLKTLLEAVLRRPVSFDTLEGQKEALKASKAIAEAFSEPAAPPPEPIEEPPTANPINMGKSKSRQHRGQTPRPPRTEAGLSR